MGFPFKLSCPHAWGFWQLPRYPPGQEPRSGALRGRPRPTRGVDGQTTVPGVRTAFDSPHVLRGLTIERQGFTAGHLGEHTLAVRGHIITIQTRGRQARQVEQRTAPDL